MQENKTIPSTEITIKKYYEKCGHTIKETNEIDDKYVNLTQEEFTEKYFKDNPKYKLESFSPQEIVVTESINASCGKHYLVTEENGKILLYKIDDSNKKVFYKDTGLTTEYLTDEDIKALDAGIRANGDDELNSVLENFVS
ncbi:MAG: BofC C-terminal domain-containing protein [Oscillospiraceae bacterium]|nr:BofC C-terminal domain-containing protein [Oscillospiraceae bacterium]